QASVGIFAPHQREDAQPTTSDLTCTRLTYTADRQWNRVSNLEPCCDEAETLTPGHHCPRQKDGSLVELGFSTRDALVTKPRLFPDLSCPDRGLRNEILRFHFGAAVT
ncbi:hypothetical protein AVEN_260157-1, partial [Araneus ventricosus]